MSTCTGPGYELVPFARIRESVIAVMTPAQKKHNIHVLFEADVTDVRKHLKQVKAETVESLSFTAFIVKCTADAAMTNKHLTSCRVSPRRLALFDDVHMMTMAETEADGEDIPVGNLVKCASGRFADRSFRRASGPHGCVIEFIHPARPTSRA